MKEVKISASLYWKIKEQADREGLTVNEFVNKATEGLLRKLKAEVEGLKR